MNLAKKDKLTEGDFGEFNRPAFSVAWIFVALVVALLGVIFFYMRQAPQGTPELASDVAVAQTPVTPDADQPEQNAAEQNSQSETATTQIVTNLKRFQDATESGLQFSEYERRLSSLRTDVNNTLPSFVRHNPSDETFRQEVAAALQDYTAAENWWKTTITNSTLFSEADRDERTQRNWASARTHLTNVEKMVR